MEREENREEGREEGRTQEREEIIKRCLEKFKSCEVVADMLDISLEEVQRVKDNYENNK